MDGVGLSGRVCLVTGATSGIGKEIARGLAARGATTLVGGRSEESAGAAARELVESTGNPNVEPAVADLSSQSQIRRLAADVETRHGRLDVLVNNAAVLVPERRVTEDGLELILATNFLAPFLLTNLLLPLLRRSAPSRIVNLVAPQWTRMTWTDLQGERRYSMERQNSQAKLALAMFTFELAQRLAGTGVTVNCVFPGFVDTGHDFSGSIGMVYKLGKPWLKSVTEGAAGPIFLASSPSVQGVTGKYFSGTTAKTPAPNARNEAAWKLAWRTAEQLTGLEDGAVPAPAAAAATAPSANGGSSFTMQSTMHFDEPPEVVFDFLSDDRNEALWEPPNVSRIEKLTSGHVGIGTTFAGLYAPRDYEMHVRIVEYDRPHLVARVTEGAVLRIDIRLKFFADEGGTLVVARWTVTPKGFMKLLRPMIERAFRKQLDLREAQIAKGIRKRVVRVD